MAASFNRADLSNQALKAWQEAHPELDPDKDKPRPKMTASHDYDTPAQKAEQFRADLRADMAEIMDELHSQRAELINIRADLEAIRAGLTQAASQPAPATNGETFAAIKIEREKRKGKYYYKMLGGQFSKHGITVWDEVLEAMELDTADYDEDDIHKLNPPLLVRFSSEPYTNDEGQPATRRKVTGRA